MGFGAGGAIACTGGARCGGSGLGAAGVAGLLAASCQKLTAMPAC